MAGNSQTKEDTKETLEIQSKLVIHFVAFLLTPKAIALMSVVYLIPIELYKQCVVGFFCLYGIYRYFEKTKDWRREEVTVPSIIKRKIVNFVETHRTRSLKNET